MLDDFQCIGKAEGARARCASRESYQDVPVGVGAPDLHKNEHPAEFSFCVAALHDYVMSFTMELEYGIPAEEARSHPQASLLGIYRSIHTHVIWSHSP